ncbi:MAG: ankyrin repeat domain-containing protein [Anaerohalosphaeraceae bacterium]
MPKQITDRFLCIVLLLFTWGCKNDHDSVINALRSGDWKTAEILVKKSPNLLNTCGKDGLSLLHKAVENNRADWVEFFIQHGADVNIRTQTTSRETPLHFAASLGYYEPARLLINHGADVNCRDDSLRTPLHLACQFSRKRIVELLVDNGADVNALARDGFTPLFIVCTESRESPSDFSIIRKLLEHGADTNYRLKGHSLLWVTLGSRCYRKAELLADCGAVLELPGEHEICRLEGEQLKDYIKWCEQAAKEFPEQLPERYRK